MKLDKSTQFESPLAGEEKFFARESPEVEVCFGALSHPGNVRETNEDYYLVVRRSRSRDVISTNLPDSFPRGSQDNAYSIVVADGMGGEAFGELASQMALRAGWELGGREINWPVKLTPDEVQETLEKIELYPLLINRALLEQSKANPALKGMGTTFTAAYTVGAEAFITHVGDSRAYLSRGDELIQLTKDQTLAQAMLDAGDQQSSPEELKHMSHVLMSCLGGSEDQVQVEKRHFHLQDCDRLMLCSDGLSDMVPPEQINELLQGTRDLQECCQQLVDQALAAGGRDNITVVIAQFRSKPPTTPVVAEGVDPDIDDTDPG